MDASAGDRDEMEATLGRDDDQHAPPDDNATNHHHQAGEEATRTEITQHFVSEAHRRLVTDVQVAMTPANCCKENRSLSTRMKNMYESCRLVAWLAGIANNESTETKCRLKGLIDDCLVLEIEVAVDAIVGVKTVSKVVAKATRAAIRQSLDVDDGPAPFAFADFGYDDYSNYLRSQLRRSDGAPLKGKCYKNKRSNLNNLFKRFKYQPTIEFQEKVDAYLDGVVRIVASAAQSGIGSIVSGKRKMSFELYQHIMVWFLQERTHEGIFARAFLALTWNLMCRAGVNSCVCLKHLLWKNDSFGLSFSHVKNDQDGSRNFHPRHIYANPDNYLVCCVNAVFEYLLCYPGLFKDEHSMLFPGPCQESRFSDNLSRVLEKHKDELRDLATILSMLACTQSERVQVPMPPVALLLHLAQLQSTTVVDGRLEVQEMYICCTNELAINMLAASLAAWMFGLQSLAQAALNLFTAGLFHLTMVLNYLILMVLLNRHLTLKTYKMN